MQILRSWGRHPQSIYGPLEEWCSYNFAAGSFHTKKLCSRRFSTEVRFYWQKHQNRVLCHPLGDLGVTYTVHLWLVGNHVVDFLLVLIELFSLALTVEALWADIGRNCGFQKRGGSLWAQISRRRGSSTNEFWRQKTRIPELSGLSRVPSCVYPVRWLSINHIFTAVCCTWKEVIKYDGKTVEMIMSMRLVPAEYGNNESSDTVDISVILTDYILNYYLEFGNQWH